MRAGKQGTGGVRSILAYSLEAHSPSRWKRYGVRHGPGPQAPGSFTRQLESSELSSELGPGYNPQSWTPRDSLSPSMCQSLKAFLSFPQTPIRSHVPE